MRRHVVPNAQSEGVDCPTRNKQLPEDGGAVQLPVVAVGALAAHGVSVGHVAASTPPSALQTAPTDNRTGSTIGAQPIAGSVHLWFCPHVSMNPGQPESGALSA